MMRPSRGCTTQLKKPLGLDVKYDDPDRPTFKYEYHFCPVNYVQLHHKTWLGLYSLFRQGKLLEAGGIGDQPAKYVDIMLFLDSVYNQAQREALEGSKSGGKQ